MKLKTNIAIKCDNKEQVIEARKRLIEMGYEDIKDWNDSHIDMDGFIYLVIYKSEQFELHNSIGGFVIEPTTFKEFFKSNERNIEEILKGAWHVKVTEEISKEAREWYGHTVPINKSFVGMAKYSDDSRRKGWDYLENLTDPYYTFGAEITPEEFLKYVVKKEIQSDAPSHYDNSKGSLYLFAKQHDLNAYEFDLIKRIVRCRKKGAFKEDLEKSKFLIDLYIKEFENQ